MLLQVPHASALRTKIHFTKRDGPSETEKLSCRRAYGKFPHLKKIRVFFMEIKLPWRRKDIAACAVFTTVHYVVALLPQQPPPGAVPSDTST
jgi:hypothetical protein